MEAGQFRDDLYYRLNVISIHLPLLRERKEDIPLPGRPFLKEIQLRKRANTSVTFAADAMEALMDYDWPGNVRQLENAVSHAVILAQGDVIRRRHLPRFLRETAAAPCPRLWRKTNVISSCGCSRNPIGTNMTPPAGSR